MKENNNEILSPNIKGALETIESDGAEIAKASDALRTTLRLLCGATSKNFKTSAEAKAFLLNVKDWKHTFIESDTSVRCEGVLVHSLKKPGLEFTSRHSFLSRYTDIDTPESSYHLSFQKFDGLWQFCVVEYSEGGEFPSLSSFDNTSRDSLPLIVKDLPRFIIEFSEYVKKKKEDYLAFSKYANTLDWQFGL